MSQEHSAEWLRGAVAALAEVTPAGSYLSLAESICSVKEKYRALLAAAEAREAGKPVGWVYKLWVNKHMTGAPLPGEEPIPGGNGFGKKSDHIHFSTERPVGLWTWWESPVYTHPPTQPTAAEVIEDYIDDHGMKCDCCQHVMIDVTAVQTGCEPHCFAGDPEGDGSACAWGFHHDEDAKESRTKAAAVKEAAEVIAGAKKALEEQSSGLHSYRTDGKMLCLTQECLRYFPPGSTVEEHGHAPECPVQMKREALAAIAAWEAAQR